MLKGYTYRLHPTPAQEEFLIKTIGCARFIYNKLLEDRIAIREEAKAGSGLRRKPATPASYKPLFPFLAEADSLALANAKLNLDTAFAKFFAGTGGFPVFKSRRRSRASYTTNNQHGTIRIEAGKVRLTKVGFVRFSQHRPFEGIIKSATVSMTRTGKFFISILVEQDDEPWIPAENKVVIDLGLEHFAVMTNDAMVSEKIENPRVLHKSEENVKKAQRALSRKKIGSKNREKAKLLLAKKHEKIANQRKDFLHKLSRRIVDENQVIVVETLKSKDMMQNHKVAKSIADVSWYEFVRQLEYKCKFYGRTLIKADQWFASTQICSTCGAKGEKKTMDVREWTCACGAHHDRDINASINLLMLAD
ncbi:IS200/IS605 family element transposase accessory protein TnpB [Exiguobacterium sp. PFWT01]|uniref:IS200/IS605 family element RNA-guided endonuclease TnpB n=1 Tax=Exiguobacterium sp. PFWT01 TaxID=2829816 RepID=UPI001BABBF2F|nr:IS200/IS605 family element RNA-guided endonuclease TnpB [Exiguobacterium sp. PFWT01]QUP86398.1 IS200/IS605 family element transposase accessory protein TnpB [Exiguobacterium sp. PFWT01]